MDDTMKILHKIDWKVSYLWNFQTRNTDKWHMHWYNQTYIWDFDKSLRLNRFGRKQVSFLLPSPLCYLVLFTFSVTYRSVPQRPRFLEHRIFLSGVSVTSIFEAVTHIYIFLTSALHNILWFYYILYIFTFYIFIQRRQV
jgi:hypothetical protein